MNTSGPKEPAQDGLPTLSNNFGVSFRQCGSREIGSNMTPRPKEPQPTLSSYVALSLVNIHGGTTLYLELYTAVISHNHSGYFTHHRYHLSKTMVYPHQTRKGAESL